jgi:hypothetical protein
MEREIERAGWRSFFDGFSRKHDGWLVTLDCDRVGCAFRDLPLRSIAVDERIIEIFVTSADGSHINHIVRKPVRVVCEEASEGGDVAITVTNAQGGRTVVALRSAVRRAS